MSDGTTYDARVYRTEVYKGKKITTYHVRWKVGGKLWREGFRTAAQADSFRSALLTAARRSINRVTAGIFKSGRTTKMPSTRAKIVPSFMNVLR